MSKPLPTGGFEWMTENELMMWEKFNCILEVDLEYPEKLHNLHNDYPVAPERLVVNKVKNLYLTSIIKQSIFYIMRT